MTRRTPSPRLARRHRLVVGGLSLLAVAGGALSACGDGGTAGAPDPTTAAGKRGLEVAKSNGCQACHTANGDKSTGPTWKGLYGSKVELADGKAVTADDAYLSKAITDPKAQVVEGFASIMPANSLSGSEVADVIAYLKELAKADG
ncbi:c-type cytochrome [Aquihabitans sp. G128]|uniref:c-type cytochrome n=1 Tax=Aquihabitans sp. G128 TaxID=2849779 RepID=UPI001C2197FC|nr:cytochrome c [Aquihabitans sp. G128]QXC62842.1 c-type cytochrome [Aquihabitans sp. G128]